MNLFSRLALGLSALLLLPLPAQAKPDEAQVPWLYRGSDVPQDRAWGFGELPNGVRYAVRRNGVPPGQVSIRVLVDAGSLYETEPERGFAHLLEHMVFRESRDIPDGQAIHMWQRLGAAFGSDTNAQTSFTQTVYKIDLPEASPEKLDESFRLLSGMMIAPKLSAANLKADLPIVLSEMRDGGGAQKRVADALLGTLFAGQPMAQRLPIGTLAALEGASEASVRAFHRRWYRPQRTILVVAGDAAPAEMEALIVKYFGDWKVSGKLAAAPSFGDPVAPAGADPANPVGETRVLVEPDLPREAIFSILRPWRPVNDTIAYNQGLMVDRLALAVLTDRLSRRGRMGGSFLNASVDQQDISRSADVTQVSVTPLDNDWRSALRDVRALIADALAAPPSEEEIEKAAAEMQVAYQVPLEQRRIEPSSQLADTIVAAVDIRETVAAPDIQLDIFRSAIPLFTPENVLKHTRQLFTGSVVRGLYITPAVGEADAPDLHAALAVPVAGDASARLSSARINFADMPPVGAPGEIAAMKTTGVPGLEQIDFANGVKALVYPARDEPGRVGVKVRFGGGYRMFGPGESAQVLLGQMALIGSGQSQLGQEELDRITTGRKLGFDFDIEDGAFQFFAETREADLADQLYLFADKLARPKWDEVPFRRAKAAARINYDSFEASPQGVLQRDLKFLQRAGDGRFRTPDPAAIAAASHADFQRIWARALASGPIEVQIYGDVDRNATIAALQRTFGALAVRPPLPADIAPATARFPVASGKPVVLTHNGDADQSAVLVSWKTGGGAAGVRESRQLYILGELFTNRLIDAVREKLGASYSPQVAASWPMDLDSGGTIDAIAQVDPAAIPLFTATVKQIAADLIGAPVSADELARVTEPLRQQVMRASTGSAFMMGTVEGATQDPRRFASVASLLADYSQTTPEAMQALAARYLAPDKAWELVVVPAGSQIAGEVPPR